MEKNGGNNNHHKNQTFPNILKKWNLKNYLDSDIMLKNQKKL